MNQAYLELKLAWQLHGQPPEKLADDERLKLHAIIRRQQALESRILASPEAMCAVVTPEAIAKQMEILRARYSSRQEMAADLARLGMSLERFEEAITRDLLIELTLDRVASQTTPVCETDAEIFYRLHPEKFTRPERRVLRHILITFGNATEGHAARSRLDALRQKIGGIEDFASAALEYSHCPTALEGGSLGTLGRGQLYPELDRLAFSMSAGQLSQPVCSEMGWHLLYCESVTQAGLIPFAEIREELMRRMNRQREEQARRNWIAALRREAA